MSILIQKGYFKKDIKEEDIIGIDSLIGCPAMFYAEYEFGALPASLKAMTRDFSKMEFFQIDFPKSKKHPVARTVTVLANLNKDYEPDLFYLNHPNPIPTNRKEYIIEEIKEIGNWKLSTKGYSKFPSYLEMETKEYPVDAYEPIDFWWNINKNYMFFIDDEAGTKAKYLTIAFDKLAEKWKAELFPETVKKKSFFIKVKDIFCSHTEVPDDYEEER